jgi:hypothetical protein
VFAAVAVVAGTVGARLAFLNNEAPDGVLWLIPSGALLLAAAGALVVLVRQRQSERELLLELSTERDVLDLVWAVETRELWELAALSHRQMTRFECTALGQAQRSYSASVAAAASALLVLLVGAVSIVVAAGTGATITASALTAIGVTLSGFVSAIFLKTYRLTVQQMGYYYGQPLVNCYLLHAERLLKDKGVHLSQDERRNAFSRVQNSLLQAAKLSQLHLFELQGVSGQEQKRGILPRATADYAAVEHDGAESSLNGLPPSQGSQVP